MVSTGVMGAPVMRPPVHDGGRRMVTRAQARLRYGTTTVCVAVNALAPQALSARTRTV
jgi:hypothetical protein